MKAMLDRAMEKQISEAEAEALKTEYTERFSLLFKIFESKPFALPPDEKGRTRVSAAVYDSAMVAINDLWERREEIEANAAVIRTRMAAALHDPDQIHVLTGQGNTAKAVKERIELMRKILAP